MACWRQLPPAALLFLQDQAGTVLYEAALLASLFAVLGVIVLIALSVIA